MSSGAIGRKLTADFADSLAHTGKTDAPRCAPALCEVLARKITDKKH
jgi:hypothetical protein